MPKYLPTIFIAIAISLFLSFFLFSALSSHWVPMLFFWAVGIMMAVVIKETKAVKFLGRIFLGSLAAGILSVGIYSLSAAPSPLEISWALLPLMGFAAGLVFFGGLIGLFFKGVYDMIGRKTDRLLVFGAPLALAGCSLFVSKVKYGGTVLSHLHGWPYPLASYAVREINGPDIGEWHPLLGSMFSNPIRNYLFYFLIFAGAYCLGRWASRAVGEGEIGRRDMTAVLFGLALIGVLGLCSFMPLWEMSVNREIANAQYCKADSDCVIAGSSPPFSCAITVNRNEAKRILSLVAAYPTRYELDCWGEAGARCESKTCRPDFSGVGED